MAGQQSTDRAIDNGRRALHLAYSSSEKNTVELSNAILSNVVNRVVGSLRKDIASMEYRLKVAEDFFYGFNGTWSEFDARFLVMFRLMTNADASSEDMRFQVFTTQGFFLNMLHKTDDRADDVRNDGVIGSVAETNEGWRYGVNAFSAELVSRKPLHRYTLPSFKFNASRMLAGNIGDPLAATAAMPSGHTTWIPAKLTFPLGVHYDHPMSAYRPLLSPDGRHVGTIEVYQQLPLFVKAALDTAVLDASNLQNMSVVVMDDTDKAILAAHNIGTEASRSEGLAFLGKYDPMHGLYSMYEHPSIKVTALANYLDSVDGWTGHAGLFDQKDHFIEQPFITLAKVTASGGRVFDTGVHKWDVEMRDGACGTCVVFDTQLQKEVLTFDGATTLHLYRNVTRNTPVVAQSQVSGPGEPWRSRYEAFNDRLVHADGSECVARVWHETADQAKKHCLVRHDISVGSEFMVSMRVRPDVAYTETAPSASTPRLFSDLLVGDANIRLFANGQLYLYVLRYGCRTKPYEGGLPVGVWTTVTAVVGDGLCRVFVNGTEYSAGHDGRDPIDSQQDWGRGSPDNNYDVRLHADPYRAGQLFKGRMDSLQLFRYIMSDEELVSLHTTDNLVRDVGRVNHFTQTSTLDMNVEIRAGVKWGVAVVVPRDDIMRVVDANRRETLEDVQVEEDNTTKELAQRANVTVMVIVAIAMTSVLVFLVFNSMMTRPFERVAVVMADAAVLRIDSIPQGTSLITELGAMHKAMVLMLENLKLYKSFMPQSVQLDDHQDVTPECSLQEGSSSHSHPSSSLSSSSGRAVVPTAPRQLACSLTKKRFTFLALNLRRWHATTTLLGVDQVIALHASILDMFLTSFNTHKGVGEVFSGDRFVCTFNAVKNTGQHKNLACACALQCIASIKKLGHPLSSHSLSSAAVSGEGLMGNMGNTSMRRFSVLNPVVTWGYALERYCCGRDLTCMIDPAVQAEANLTMSLRLVDAVVFPKLSELPVRVFQLVGAKETPAVEEWMYQLQAAEKNDPMAEWNSCAAMIVDGNFEDETTARVMARETGTYATRMAEAFRARMFVPSRIENH